MIQLIRPPYRTDSVCPPINLMALGAHLERDYPVSILDFVIPYVRDEMSLDAEGIRVAASQVLESPAQVLGFTAMCSSYAAALRIAQECRRQDPSRFILFGGPHASFVARETLEAFDFVDAVIAGEGEEPVLALLKAIEEQQTFRHIPGLIFRQGSQIILNQRAPVVDDLDSLAFPAFHLIPDVDLYYAQDADRFIEIEAGRGCPFTCNFCSTSLFFARKYRVKSPARLLNEMRWLKQNWRIKSFGLIHDNLTVNKATVRELCRHILESGESFAWHCSSRTDTIDRGLMEVMHSAGCQGIFFGVETGSQQMQKIMGKRLKIESVRKTFQDLQEAGIDSTASFIIGFPEETPDMLEETLTMALELRLADVRDVQLHPLSALPGTQVLTQFEECLQFHPHLLTFHDITSVIDITEKEMAWIHQHRRIFSNFYAVPPMHYPLELVYKIRGCYFYLIHFRPYALCAIKLIANLRHTEIVEQLCSKLPPAYDQWTPEELLRALKNVVAEMPEDQRGFIEDVLTYEETVLGLAPFTDGANGWIHYKGPAPAAYTSEHTGPRLKPARVMSLSYDVPVALRVMRSGACPALLARDLNLVVVFEWEGRRIRTLEVDTLTALIVEQNYRNGQLLGGLRRLAVENPFLNSDGERAEWVAKVLDHLRTAGLIVENPALDVEMNDAVYARASA